MKRFVKWCLILVGVLLAVGIGLRVAGAVMGGRAESNSYYARRWNDFSDHWGGFSHHWPVGGLLGETQTKNSGAIDDTITAIDVDVDCGDVTLRQGEYFSVSMAWNLRGFTLDYEVEDGVLKVESDSKSGFLNGVSGWKNEVTITVPVWAMLDKIDLSTNLGDVDVDVDAIFMVDEADLATNLGDVSCGNGMDARKLTAETDLGDVKVSLLWGKENYRWELETDLGKVSMDGETLTSAKLQSGKGTDRVEARSSLGDVSVRFGSGLRPETTWAFPNLHHPEHGYIHG